MLASAPPTYATERTIGVQHALALRRFEGVGVWSLHPFAELAGHGRRRRCRRRRRLAASAIDRAWARLWLPLPRAGQCDGHQQHGQEQGSKNGVARTAAAATRPVHRRHVYLLAVLVTVRAVGIQAADRHISTWLERALR